MLYDKRHLYETDLRVPMAIHGPHIANQGSSTDMIATAVDLAPTIIDLAVGQVPEDMDGMSLKQYIIEPKKNMTIPTPPKQQQFYVYVGIL